MRTRLSPLLLLAALALSAFSAGCSTYSADSNTIPQSRPASWQGGVPGMGALTNSGSGFSGGNGVR